MLSSTGIVIGLLGLLWYMVAGPGTTACLLDASGRGSTHLPSKKTNTRVGKKKNRRREDGKAAMDPPPSCPLGRVDVKFNCDIVKLLRSTVNVAIWCVRSCLVDCEVVVYAPLLSTCVRIAIRDDGTCICRRDDGSSGTCVPDMLEVANLTCKLCCCCKLCCSTVI